MQSVSNHILESSQIGFGEKDFQTIAEIIGCTREREFFVNLLLNRTVFVCHDFHNRQPKYQINILKKMALLIRTEFQIRLEKALQNIFQKRLDFSKYGQDHRFSVLPELIKIIGLVSKPEETINALVNNLAKVFTLQNKISVEEGIRRWQNSNVKDQFSLLKKAAELL